MIWKLAEHAISEVFVEGPRLKAVCVEVNSDTAAFSCRILGCLKQIATVPIPTVRLLNPERFDEQPTRVRFTQQSTGDSSIGVTKHEIQIIPNSGALP